MIKYNYIAGLLLLFTLPFTKSFSQPFNANYEVFKYGYNNTNSPYTRYGLGQLAPQRPGNSSGMGGVAYALRNGINVNFTNPASYTAIDSLTFIFDGGVDPAKYQPE